MKRSFCMTSFNAGDRIEVCIDSIATHMTNEDELICVDNFSNKKTQYAINRALVKHHNKNIKIYFYHCNRGLGFDLAHRFAVGDYTITVASDTIYTPIFWGILDKWFKSKDSKKYVLFGRYFHVFPIELYYAVGGYKHFNATEDTNLYNRLARLDLVKHCLEKDTGFNLTIRHHERRFVNNPIHLFWRILVKYKDNIRADDTKDLTDRLNKAAKFSNKQFTFYLFWVPLIVVLSSYRLFEKKREFIRKPEFEFHYITSEN